ncbi:hypothetical protein BDN71DRAFT_1454324, partial [Pleurotus eryngii]
MTLVLHFHELPPPLSHTIRPRTRLVSGPVSPSFPLYHHTLATDVLRSHHSRWVRFDEEGL